MRTAFEDLSRLGRITNVLVRHGFGRIALRAGLPSRDGDSSSGERAAPVDVRSDPEEAARRFRAMLEELGPTFVKVGQILSTRVDLLPAPFITELARLQDAVPPLPADEIRAALEAGLEGPIDEHFEGFEDEPLASASIAQTHLAELKDGGEVVVKVQRPGIAETIRSDLDLLFLFAKFLELTIAEMEMYAPGDIVRALDEALTMELDFSNEAANLSAFYQNFRDSPDIKIPKIHPQHSGRSVLTMERIVGRKIDALEPGSDEARARARQLLEALFVMIFEHGLFHADPHPGNLFIMDDGRIGLIDFGLCARLTPTQQDRLASLVVAVMAGDIDGIARSLLRMGRPQGHVPMGEFKAEIASVRDRYLRQSLHKLDAAAFATEVLDSSQRFRVPLATEYALIAKCAATLDGIIRVLDPDFDILKEGQPYARRMLAQRYTQQRVLEEAFSGLMSLSTFLREVPDQLSQILRDAEGGTLRVHTESEQLKHIESQLNTQTTRLFMAVCCGALTIATPLFLYQEQARGEFPLFALLSALTASALYWGGMGWHLLGGRFRKIRLSPLLRFLKRRGG